MKQIVGTLGTKGEGKADSVGAGRLGENFHTICQRRHGKVGEKKRKRRREKKMKIGPGQMDKGRNKNQLNFRQKHPFNPQPGFV